MKFLSAMLPFLSIISICINAMEIPQKAKKSATSTTIPAIPFEAFKAEFRNFLAAYGVSYIDKEMSLCCSMHNFTQLHTLDNCIQEIYDMFIGYQIPDHALRPFLQTLVNKIKPMTIVRKLHTNEDNHYFVTKRDTKQIDQSCQYLGLSLDKKYPCEARVINLDIIKQHLLDFVGNGLEIVAMNFGKEEIELTFKNNTKKTIPNLLSNNNDIIEYTPATKEKPAKITFKNKSMQYLDEKGTVIETVSNKATTLPSYTEDMEEEKPCVNCTNFAEEGTGCDKHTYCAECLEIFLDVIGDCKECQAFHAKPSTTTNLTATNNNNNVISDCVFCGQIRKNIEKHIVQTCALHSFCEDCYAGSLPAIKACVDCKMPNYMRMDFATPQLTVQNPTVGNDEDDEDAGSNYSSKSPTHEDDIDSMNIDSDSDDDNKPMGIASQTDTPSNSDTPFRFQPSATFDFLNIFQKPSGNQQHVNTQTPNNFVFGADKLASQLQSKMHITKTTGRKILQIKNLKTEKCDKCLKPLEDMPFTTTKCCNKYVHNQCYNKLELCECQK